MGYSTLWIELVGEWFGRSRSGVEKPLLIGSLPSMLICWLFKEVSLKEGGVGKDRPKGIAGGVTASPEYEVFSLLPLSVLLISDKVFLAESRGTEVGAGHTSSVVDTSPEHESEQSLSVVGLSTMEEVLFASQRTLPKGVLLAWEAGIRYLVVLGEIWRVGVPASCSVVAASWNIIAILTP